MSPDATPCTSTFASYEVSIGGETYRLWDTPGLAETSGFQLFRQSARAAEDSVKRFLQERRRREELDLLVLCVRALGEGKTIEKMSRIYKIFCSASRQMAIPVVIAVTHLERAQPSMEAWWQINARQWGNLGLLFDGHACLTCLSPHHRRWASQQDICALISAEYPQLQRTGSTLGTIEQEYLDDPNRGCTIC